MLNIHIFPTPLYMYMHLKCHYFLTFTILVVTFFHIAGNLGNPFKFEHQYVLNCPPYLLPGIHCEPPLQTKRRTPGPQTSLHNGFYDNGNQSADEYTLLGNQDKFSQNVRYKTKSAGYARDSSPPKQMKMEKVII